MDVQRRAGHGFPSHARPLLEFDGLLSSFLFPSRYYFFFFFFFFPEFFSNSQDIVEEKLMLISLNRIRGEKARRSDSRERKREKRCASRNETETENDRYK